jgi:uncharacterized Ntn-hydrolase superfamily protein
VTYSIAARDAATGEMGVAVQSHFFAAGSIVPWAEAGVGAVATQATVEIGHGPNSLAILRRGASASEALREVLSSDDGAEHRQVGIVDADGRVAAHTGGSCIPEAGHRVGDGFSVQANMMLRNAVPGAMEDAFTNASGGLAERMLAALDAAEAQGGDVRGRQAAGILIVRAHATGKVWEDVVMHLHVDDHPTPLPELRRLVELHRAYDHLQRAEDLQLLGRDAEAKEENEAALRSPVSNTEMAFWVAIDRASSGDVASAVRTIRPALQEHDGWAQLLRRLSERGLIDLSPDVVERMLANG